MEQLGGLQALFLALVTAALVVAAVARRWGASYPIVLVIAGALLSLVPHLPRFPLPADVVFYVFLPPLLSAAAWGTSWRDFKLNFASIALLAVGLVVFTAVGVAVTAHWFLPGFDWRLGFLLGAIVSPTDAVAAGSIARRLGLPTALVQILEGESLLNDATGLLLLQVGVQMISSGTTPTAGQALWQFTWLLGGGALIGLGVGWVATVGERWLNDAPVEIMLTIVISYASYLLGEAAHTSGVISVVVCSLYRGRHSARSMSASTRLQVTSVWDALEFLLNALLFILTGLQLPTIVGGIGDFQLPTALGRALIFAAVLVALRMVWVFPTTRMAWWVRTRLLHQEYAAPTAKSMFIGGWAGMRGAISLAAAYSLPMQMANGNPLPHRSLMIFMTYVVILVTLVGQGLSLPPLIRWLGVGEGTPDTCDADTARARLARTGLSLLQSPDAGEQVDKTTLEHLQKSYTARAEYYERCSVGRQDSGEPGDGSRRSAGQTKYELLRRMVERERDELLTMRDNGDVSDALFRELERELDLEDTRFARE